MAAQKIIDRKESAVEQIIASGGAEIVTVENMEERTVSIGGRGIMLGHFVTVCPASGRQNIVAVPVAVYESLAVGDQAYIVRYRSEEILVPIQSNGYDLTSTNRNR